MSQHHSKKTSKPIRFIFEYSIFLVAGALLAFVWANVDHKSYENFINFDLKQLVTSEADAPAAQDAAAALASAEGNHEAAASPDGAEHAVGHHGFTIHFLINDVLMALFFAIAAKEVWESMLPGGALSNPRKAATPLLATLGGIVGPALIYLAGSVLVGQSGWFGQEGFLARGWAIPCATDIAFSYLVARLIFGNGHPAIAFLLLLAIADDAAGLVILAVFFPQKPIEPIWFLLTAAAMAMAVGLHKAKVQNFWWYLLIPGIMSWFSFQMAGIHAALGLVPIIPCMPHAHTDLGIFAREELNRHDTLNAFEHWWKNPVEIILGLFGLVNAGIPLSNIAAGTYLVLAGLVIGKPLGITSFTLLAEKVFKLEIPKGMTYRHVISLGMIAGIGFTVALFVAEAAYPASLTTIPSAVRDSVKMGALASFLAAIVAFVGARMLGVRPTGAFDEGADATGWSEHEQLSDERRATDGEPQLATSDKTS